MKELIVVGAGGHSKVVEETVAREGNYVIKAIADDKFDEVIMHKGRIHMPLMTAASLLQLFPEARWIIAVGSNETRRRLREKLPVPQTKYAVIIDPSAVVSPSAVIGFGTVIFANAVIQASAKIGEHVIINTSSIIEHDAFVGSYVHVSPQAVLTGAAAVLEGAHIGANASVIPGKTVGQWAIVGAGSTVVHSIPGYITAVGSPAQRIRKGGKEVEEHTG
ncbi:NeuD/PglB/VioB family sugar acetyltransferase [Alkalicoccus luteus]|uniref:Acetyltransferase n=1 Tax=Alkalicoccus luteus TaxID=1237094 RepID=A0A969TW37_9BACI|nr:acetyltransferase [Alkalicoccus luteus]